MAVDKKTQAKRDKLQSEIRKLYSRRPGCRGEPDALRDLDSRIRVLKSQLDRLPRS